MRMTRTAFLERFAAFAASSLVGVSVSVLPVFGTAHATTLLNASNAPNR